MRRRFKQFSAATTFIALGAGYAAAQISPGSQALEEANASMHHAMAIEMSGDVDVDFMRAMIPHHQGAIDMAKIVLQYGTDPDVKKLAAAVIAAQEGEIGFMRSWLEKKGVASDHSAH